MKIRTILFIFPILFFFCQGCRWNDDFRSRVQPRYLELAPRPTLNQDSKDYVGDEAPFKEEDGEKDALKAIDGLSPIPSVPEYPAGVGVP